MHGNRGKETAIVRRRIRTQTGEKVALTVMPIHNRLIAIPCLLNLDTTATRTMIRKIEKGTHDSVGWSVPRRLEMKPASRHDAPIIQKFIDVEIVTPELGG
jgi:hypothetical protein